MLMPETVDASREVETKEIIQLAAVDSLLFERVYFPKTARQKSPEMHRDLWDKLDGTDRLVNVLMSRGWGKTSKFRIFIAKRIAYRLSKTIMIVGASASHSKRTLRWIKKQIEKNTKFAGDFGLRPGVPWTDDECQILCKTEDGDEESIWLVGMGVTSGSARGVNFDDYRPDLIALDDIMNDENAKTKEGREKISDLVFGAFMESLAPESENPFAKMVMLNTPQDPNDISQQALKDKAFVSVRYGCWTAATENLPLEFRESAWPERISTAQLRQEYQNAQARNRLSLFIREKECKLATPELSAFKPEWLKYFGEGFEYPEPPRHEMWIIMVIDPAPPPSDEKLEKGIIDGDFEAISVLGRYKGDVYLLETVQNRGHDPSWTVAEFFRLAGKWRIRKCLVETIAYQKTLVWLLREAMRVRRVFYLVEEFGRKDKRAKVQKIYDGLHPVVSEQRLYVRAEQQVFIDQYVNFSTVRKIAKDDTIETVAIGCTDLQNAGLALPGPLGGEDEDDYQSLGDYRGAP